VGLSELDTVLAELAQPQDDFDARRAVLDRASLAERVNDFETVAFGL